MFVLVEDSRVGHAVVSARLMPPSAADEFYLFRLHAKRGEQTMGWDYRFRLGGG